MFRRRSEDLVNELFKRCRQVIVLDHLFNKTVQNADIILPVATFAESEGTIVNNEGRAQRFYKALVNNNQVKESWRWIGNLMKARNANGAVAWNRVDDIVESMADELPAFSKLKNYTPDADFRMINSKIPRQTIRYSGRTAMNAHIAVSETKVLQDPDSPLAFSMEGQQEKPPSSLVPFYWTPGWNSVQAMYKYLDVPDGSLKGGDPGVRLIESAKGSKNIYFSYKELVPERQKDEWLIVPVYQIFGSEELSSLSPSVLQKTLQPFVLMNKMDAEVLILKEGDVVKLEILNNNSIVKVKIDNSIKHGLAGLSVNLPGMKFVDLPAAGKFHKL